MATRLEPAEFGRLFERHARLLWVVAAAFVPRAEASDVVQEAAVVALARLWTFDPATDFRAWMSQIVRNVANNERRRLRRTPQSDLGVEPIAPATNGEAVARNGVLHEVQADFDDQVVAALRTLSDDARAALLLRVVLDLDYAEIGATLGLPAGTVASHLHRARDAMRAQLHGGEKRAPALAPSPTANLRRNPS